MLDVQARVWLHAAQLRVLILPTEQLCLTTTLDQFKEEPPLKLHKPLTNTVLTDLIVLVNVQAPRQVAKP